MTTSESVRLPTAEKVTETETMLLIFAHGWETELSTGPADCAEAANPSGTLCTGGEANSFRAADSRASIEDRPNLVHSAAPTRDHVPAWSGLEITG
ncbi:hypothetical protein [Limnoglobus roseus]|uniref:Uncharacterized protein n=1 Tax=Limnoglobus roseus TaxID=2598579 RepID=A0A5C1AEK3_9BACT|nr:hypothetical protein [Limnoglobus roseus]QEL16657.1 hypothetical protein PX52LOC_03618 [Limnoglobus roseus]